MQDITHRPIAVYLRMNLCRQIRTCFRAVWPRVFLGDWFSFIQRRNKISCACDMESSSGKQTHGSIHNYSESRNFCGLTEQEYEEPFVDSESEYEPDSDQESVSEEEINEVKFDDVENEPENNAKNFGRQDELEVRPLQQELPLQDNLALKELLSLEWSTNTFIPKIYAFDNSESEAHLETITDKSDVLLFPSIHGYRVSRANCS